MLSHRALRASQPIRPSSIVLDEASSAAPRGSRCGFDQVVVWRGSSVVYDPWRVAGRSFARGAGASDHPFRGAGISFAVPQPLPRSCLVWRHDDRVRPRPALIEAATLRPIHVWQLARS